MAIHGQQQLRDKLNRIDRAIEQTATGQAADVQRLRDDHRLRWLALRAQESPWSGVAGSPIQARLVASFDEAPVSEPIRLLAEIRNVSDQDQTVSGLLLYYTTIRLSHNGTPAKYLGPAAAIAPGRLPTLPPGRIARSYLVITPQDFAELGQPGEFTVEWSYVSGYGDQHLTWTGQLPVVKANWHAPAPTSSARQPALPLKKLLPMTVLSSPNASNTLRIGPHRHPLERNTDSPQRPIRKTAFSTPKPGIRNDMNSKIFGRLTFPVDKIARRVDRKPRAVDAAPNPVDVPAGTVDTPCHPVDLSNWPVDYLRRRVDRRYTPAEGQIETSVLLYSVQGR